MKWNFHPSGNEKKKQEAFFFLHFFPFNLDDQLKWKEEKKSNFSKQKKKMFDINKWSINREWHETDCKSVKREKRNKTIKNH